MDAAQTALSVLVSTACETLSKACPALHVTAYSEAECAALLEELNTAAEAIGAVARLVLDHSDAEAVLQSNRENP